jgi:hypothetical protein
MDTYKMNTQLTLPGLSPGLMSKLLLWSVKPSSVISGLNSGRQTGLLQSALAYGNSRFCLLKFTKPVDERDLQALARPSQTLLYRTVTTFSYATITKH